MIHHQRNPEYYLQGFDDSLEERGVLYGEFPHVPIVCLCNRPSVALDSESVEVWSGRDNWCASVQCDYCHWNDCQGRECNTDPVGTLDQHS